MCWQLRPFQNWLYQSICSLSRTQLESERSLSVWNHGLWSTMSLVLSILRQWFYIHFRSSKATLCTPRQCTLAFPLIYTISCHRLCCTWLGTLPNCSLNEQNNKVLSLLLLFWCFFCCCCVCFPQLFSPGQLSSSHSQHGTACLMANLGGSFGCDLESTLPLIMLHILHFLFLLIFSSTDHCWELFLKACTCNLPISSPWLGYQLLC